MTHRAYLVLLVVLLALVVTAAAVYSAQPSTPSRPIPTTDHGTGEAS